MIDPKWLVMGGALISTALVLNYDLRLGLAASVLLGISGALYFWVSFRLARGHGEPRSEREVLFGRLSGQARNRQAARMKELERIPLRNDRKPR